MHSLTNLVAFLFPHAYSRRLDHPLRVRNMRRPHLLLQDANRNGDKRQFKKLLKGQCPLGQVADVAGFLVFHVKYSTTRWRAYCAGPGCAKKIRGTLGELWELELESIPGSSFCPLECAQRAEALP